jgi:ABC-type Fe3+/spermidine/putrescine transport system ATPase subunit
MVVRVLDVSKRFGDVHALSGINLSVRRGEFLTLLGPSGCGKSTLLRIISGLESPSEGRIWVGDKDVTDLLPERRPTNMVFQHYALFPHLSVSDNVAFGLRIQRVPKEEVSSRVSDALRLVRLEGLGGRQPHQLSGGQAQRVALARALVNEPQVLLLDEPLSALDRKIRQQMQAELRVIQAKVGTTFIYVTHDQDEAMSMSTRIALMQSGRIHQLAAPTELYRRPTSEFAAGFVGDANILEGELRLGHSGGVLLWMGLELVDVDVAPHAREGPVRFVARPDAMTLVHLESGVNRQGPVAVVQQSDFFGFFWIHRLDMDGEALVFRELRQEPSVTVGGLVRVVLEGRDVTVLSSED